MRGRGPTAAPADTLSPPPTEAPTATASPSPTPEPTATPKPTDTPVPPATAVPEPEVTQETAHAEQVPGTGAITPLHLNDPLTVASELSAAELTCLAGVAEIARLMEIFAAPELASPEERANVIGLP